MSRGGTKNRLVGQLFCHRTLYFFVFLFVLSVQPVIALEANSILINEVAWMGDNSDTNGYLNEWIELYNNTQNIVNIENWQIENGLAKNETLIIANGAISPNEYFVVCKKPLSFCDLTEPNMSLHNKYDANGALVLKDASEVIINQTPTPENKNWPAGNNEPKQTMQLCDNGWQTSPEPNGTPNQANDCQPEKLEEPDILDKNTSFSQQDVASSSDSSDYSDSSDLPDSSSPPPIPNQTVYPTNILVNEVMPSPEGPDAENEWIEIFNNNNFIVDLADWKIKDTVGNAKTHVFPTTKITAFGYFALWRPQSKITLQNSGDGLVLSNPNGAVVDKIEFGKAKIGESYCRFGNDWQWCIVPSPGKQNIANPTAEQNSAESKINNNASSTTSSANINQKIQKQTPHNNKLYAEQTQNPIFWLVLGIMFAGASAFFVLFLNKKTADK